MITRIRFIVAHFLVCVGRAIIEWGIELSDGGSVEVEFEVLPGTRQEFEIVATVICAVVAAPVFWVITVVVFCI